MCLPVLKHPLNLGIHSSAIGLQLLADEPDSAKRHNGTLEGGVGLKTDNLLQILVNITGLIGIDVRNGVLINIQNTARLSFLGKQIGNFRPKLNGPLCRRR